MRNSKLVKIGSSILCAVLLGSVLAVPQTASASTEQVTYVGFEDMSSVDEQFSLGADNTAASEYWTTYATVDSLSEGGKALHLKGGAAKSYTLYLSQGWNDNTRPTEVQYRYKVVSDRTTTANKDAFYLRPIYHAKTDGVCFPLRVYAQTRGGATKCTNNTSGAAWGAKCGVASNVTTNVEWNIATTEADSPWIQTTLKYDWGKYNAENSYELSVKVLMTNLSTGDTVSDYTMTTSQGTSSHLMEMIATKTKYLGFSIGAVGITGLDTWIDDIYVWSEDFTTGETYGPSAQPKVLGATPATTATDNSIKVKMGFDFSSVEAIAKANGETPVKYGAVLVPGSSEYTDIVANAGLLLDHEEANDLAATDLGYKCTETELTGETKLPKEYYVTISNSNENLGKRASAIAYVITTNESGAEHIYYSATAINHSVMSLLKAAFTKTYLADINNVLDDAIVSGSPLEVALNNYNTANGTAETLATIKSAVAGGTTTQAQRDLLIALHLALNNQ